MPRILLLLRRILGFEYSFRPSHLTDMKIKFCQDKLDPIFLSHTRFVDRFDESPWIKIESVREGTKENASAVVN